MSSRWLPLLLVVACSQPGSSAVSPPPRAPTAPTAPPVAAAGLAPAGASAPAPALAAPPPPPAKHPKVVLHVGDSMTGGYGGLSKALEAHFRRLGATTFVRDHQDSLAIRTYAQQKTLEALIKKHDPDTVIITLGANDVQVPFPSSLARYIESIAKRTEGRDCYWTSPPLWRQDTGVVEVLKQHAAPCKVYDPAGLTVARRRDGIHPTERGGETWAEGFARFYEAAPSAPASPDAASLAPASP